MRRREAKARRTQAHRARPVIEGLEGRQLLSAGASHAAAARAAAATPGGVLSAKGQVFQYVTINGGIATIKIVGVGSLDGTSVDSAGNLHVVYGGTNVYSKIVGTVKGGGGHASLASIQNLQLINAGTPDSLTGVGGTPLAAVLMSPFNLVPGGTINLTPGVTSVVLNCDRPEHEHPAPQPAAGPVVPRPAGERRQHRGRAERALRPVGQLQHQHLDLSNSTLGSTRPRRPPRLVGVLLDHRFGAAASPAG